MISFADLEVQPFSTPAHGDGYETIEKQVPYAAPLPASSYCEQKQLRFVGHDSGKRESDNVLPLPRQAQPHPRHRHQSGALGCGPRLAVGRVETVVHDAHHRIEVEDPALGDGDLSWNPCIGLASLARP